MKAPKYTVVGPENPESVIFVLHGYGETREQIKEYGRKFSERFPTSAIVLPEGPQKVGKKAGGGLGWDTPNIKFRKEHSDPNGLNPVLTKNFNKVGSIDALHNLYDEVLDKYRLDAGRAAMFGFSEGGNLAIHSTLSYDRPFKAVVAHSAQFFDMKPKDVHAHPHLLYIHGDNEGDGGPNTEGNLSFASAFARVKALTSAREDEIKGLGHRVNDESLDHSFRFIETNFNTQESDFPKTPAAAVPEAKI